MLMALLDVSDQPFSDQAVAAIDDLHHVVRRHVVLLARPDEVDEH